MNKLFLISLVVLLAGCQDYSENLGNRFLYIDEGTLQVTIGKESYREVDTGIPSVVMNYKYDSTYIIATQKDLNTKACRIYIDTSSEHYKAYDACKEDIFSDKTPLNYWLIIKPTNTVIGRMNYDSFQKKRVELGLSDKLNFTKDGK